MADSIYSQRSESVERLLTRFNEMALPELSRRIIQISRTLDILQRPGASERDEQGRIRSYLRSLGFESVDAAITRMQIERRQMFASLAERTTSETVSEVGTPESSVVTSLIRIMNRIEEDPDLTNESARGAAQQYIYGYDFRDGALARLRTTLTSPPDAESAIQAGVAPAVFQGDRPVPYVLRPVEAGHTTAFAFTRDSYATYPDGVEPGAFTQDIFRRQGMEPTQVLESARQGLFLIADAITYLNTAKRDWTSTTELLNDSGARSRATALAEYLQANVSARHPILSVEDGEGNNIWHDAMEALGAGRLEEGLRLLRQLDQLDPVFNELSNIVIYRPHPIGFERFTIETSAVIELDRQSRDTIAAWIRGEEGNESSVIEAIDIQYRRIWGSGALTAQMTELVPDGDSLRLQPSGSPTVVQVDTDTHEGEVGIRWGHRIFGRPVLMRFSMAVGYTEMNESGDVVVTLPSGDQRTIPGLERTGMLYIGLIEVSANLPQVEGRTRMFDIVNVGLGFTRPLTVDLEAQSGPEATGSADWRAYVTLTFPRVQHENFQFDLFHTLVVGMTGHQSGAVEHDPGFRFTYTAAPNARWSWGPFRGVGQPRYLELTAPMFSITHHTGGMDVFDQDAPETTLIELGGGLRGRPLPGVELGLSAGYAWPGRHTLIEGGPQVRATLALNFAEMVPRRSSTRVSVADDVPVTAGEMQAVREAYVAALDAVDTAQEASVRARLLTALQAIPRESVLVEDRESRHFSDALDALEGEDLSGALDALVRIRAFGEMRRERIAQEREE
ncbi:MAG: hypothetical protein ABII71_01455 [Candidatus Micrarchaeota archaeon]